MVSRSPSTGIGILTPRFEVNYPGIGQHWEDHLLRLDHRLKAMVPCDWQFIRTTVEQITFKTIPTWFARISSLLIAFVKRPSTSWNQWLDLDLSLELNWQTLLCWMFEDWISIQPPSRTFKATLTPKWRKISGKLEVGESEISENHQPLSLTKKISSTHSESVGILDTQIDSDVPSETPILDHVLQ